MYLKKNQTNQLDYWNQLLIEKSQKIWIKRRKLWIEFSEEFEKTWNTFFPERKASINYYSTKDLSIEEITKKLSKIKDVNLFIKCNK